MNARSEATQAEHFYSEAVEVARGQEAGAQELEAALGLARLCVHRVQQHPALDRLSSQYSWFTEGFGTAILKRATALPDELEAFA